MSDMSGALRFPVCHASHEACELKLYFRFRFLKVHCHASHEACELKFGVNLDYVPANDVTPRMRRVS